MIHTVQYDGLFIVEQVINISGESMTHNMNNTIVHPEIDEEITLVLGHIAQR